MIGQPSLRYLIWSRSVSFSLERRIITTSSILCYDLYHRSQHDMVLWSEVELIGIFSLFILLIVAHGRRSIFLIVLFLISTHYCIIDPLECDLDLAFIKIRFFRYGWVHLWWNHSMSLDLPTNGLLVDFW